LARASILAALLVLTSPAAPSVVIDFTTDRLVVFLESTMAP